MPWRFQICAVWRWYRPKDFDFFGAAFGTSTLSWFCSHKSRLYRCFIWCVCVCVRCVCVCVCVRFVELQFQWMEYLTFMEMWPTNFGRIFRKMHNCLFKSYTHTHTDTVVCTLEQCHVWNWWFLYAGNSSYFIVKVIVNNYGTNFTSHVGVSGMWHILWNVLCCNYQNTQF